MNYFINSHWYIVIVSDVVKTVVNYDDEIRYECLLVIENIYPHPTQDYTLIIYDGIIAFFAPWKKSNNSKKKYFESEQNVPSAKQTDRARFCLNENWFRSRFKMEKKKKRKKMGKSCFLFQLKTLELRPLLKNAWQQNICFSETRGQHLWGNISKADIIRAECAKVHLTKARLSGYFYLQVVIHGINFN